MDTEEDFRNLYTTPPVSHAEQYPDVPQPLSPLSPQLLGARWQSHDLYGEDMPQVAADLLEAGYDSPSLRRLAGEISVGSSSDVEPLVGKVFHELRVPYPISDSEAKLIVSRQIAREVISGTRNPWAAASHLEIAIWGWHPSTPILGDIFEINDELDWEWRYRRPLDSLTASLLDDFASLARMEDGEIFG